MLSEDLQRKYGSLKTRLASAGHLAVAFSSGVDSAFLLSAALDALGADGVLALTAVSCFFPKRETEEARQFCKERGIRQIFVEFDPLASPGIRENPPDRCYLCKKGLFTKLAAIARENGFDKIAEGSNLDDLGDYRPGKKAIVELGILSPLLDAELSKSEIRSLSREFGLPTHAKPAFACLASRVPYGETITEEKLSMVEKAEQYLLGLGFTQFRVRVHGKAARIEVLPEEIGRFLQKETREEISSCLHSLGFLYVSLDLDGYRTGNLNRMIGK